MTDTATDPEDLFDSAIELHQAGRLAEAQALYHEILALDPEHPGALYLLGGIAYQHGEYEQARTLVERALVEAPDDPDALHLLASIALRQRDAERGLEFAERALALHPAYAQAHHTRAELLRALGRGDEAVAGWRRALELDPQLAEAHCQLGLLLGQQGRTAEAIACHRQALALQPRLVAAQHGLGEILHAQGDHAGAIECFRKALAVAPDHVPTHGMLGNALRAIGDFENAAACYRRVIALQRGQALAHNCLGLALRALGRAEEAATSYRNAVAAQPDYAEALSNLGVVLHELGRLDEAVECYRRAAALRPDAAEIHANLANALLPLGAADEAIARYRRALELKPDLPQLHNYLGRALKQQQHHAEAADCFRRAIALQPDYAEAYSNLGNAQLRQGQVDAAITSYRQALALQPDFAEVQANLGIALKDCGRLDEAIDCFRRAIALKPDYIDGYTNYLVAIQYSPDYTPEQLCADHRAFGEQVEGPWRSRWPRYDGRRDPARAPRVGFVSGDFREHPVGFFLESALMYVDRRVLDIVLYPTVAWTDALTQRLRDLGWPWRPLAGLDDEQAMRHIADDGIDILVDLSGHTADHRLTLFARKPAPIQVGWLGYWATTGLQAMDYILYDPYSVPPHEAHHFVEEPWHLPETHLCFTPPREAFEPGPLPARANGHVTFGCFNNLTKMTDAVVAVWAQLLQRVPGSRLLLKSRPLADAGTRAAVERRFAAHGIDAGRLLLEPHSSRADYLLTYNRVDIALDPFPFTGATTSVEGLWMGVPLVTLRGDRLVGHQGEAILHNLDLPDWIGADPADYVARAARHAADLSHLATLRTGLRERLLASPLCDGPRFARNLEAAFTGMWRRFCATDQTQ